MTLRHKIHIGRWAFPAGQVKSLSPVISFRSTTTSYGISLRLQVEAGDGTEVVQVDDAGLPADASN